MSTSRTIALGAGALVAGVIALVAVHPWGAVEPSLKMAAPSAALRGPTPDKPAEQNPLPSPAVAAKSSPAASAPERPAEAPKVAELEPTTPAQAAAPPAVEPAEAKTAAKPVPAPQFDVVRVEPSGDALLAGRASPNAKVALVDRGKVVDEAKTDAAGNFVMTPPALKPGDYALSLREGSTESKQSVTVSVPKKKTQQVVVAMAEPGHPTALLSAPPIGASPAEAPPATPAPPPSAAAPAPTVPTPAPQAATPAVPAPALAIRSVEVENGTGFYATGSAPPKADVRLYLNDSRIADVTASPAGSWSVTVRRGLAGGHYIVRADRIDAAGTVTARVEVPFDVPPPAVASAEPAAAPPPSPSAPSPSAAPALAAATPAAPPPAPEATAAIEPRPAAVSAPVSPAAVATADVVLDRLETELVTRGDNLWRISRHRLGQGTRYTQIYAANAAQIRNPGLIYPGQVFVLPRE